MEPLTLLESWGGHGVWALGRGTQRHRGARATFRRCQPHCWRPVPRRKGRPPSEEDRNVRVGGSVAASGVPRPWGPTTRPRTPKKTEGRSELSRGLLEVRKSLFPWAGWPLGRPGPQLGAAAALTTSWRASPSLVQAGPPSTWLHGTGEGAQRPRGTRSARSNAGQEVGWIFHVGSQTKAPGSIFLQMQNRKSGTRQLSVGIEVQGHLAQTGRWAEWPRCGAGCDRVGILPQDSFPPGTQAWGMGQHQGRQATQESLALCSRHAGARYASAYGPPAQGRSLLIRLRTELPRAEAFVGLGCPGAALGSLGPLLFLQPGQPP